MPIDLELPDKWSKRGWKAKIADKERLEPPHVTIIHKTRRWRLSLRTKQFMDKQPNPSDVPDDLVAHLLDDETWKAAVSDWDSIYSTNPVGDTEDDDDISNS